MGRKDSMHELRENRDSVQKVAMICKKGDTVKI